jgi:hypothetical protein
MSEVRRQRIEYRGQMSDGGFVRVAVIQKLLATGNID